MKTINIFKELNSEFLISATKGEQLYEILYDDLKRGEILELDFSHIKSTITAFFFACYGKFFKDFDKNFIDTHIQFKNTKESSNLQIKDVKTTAIEFYKRGL